MKRQPQKIILKDSCDQKGPKRIIKRKTQKIVRKYSPESSPCNYRSSKAIPVEHTTRQNSMRLNLHETFSHFCQMDQIKTIIQNFYTIF